MATVGAGGTTPYLAGELLKGMTGVEWVWVQYRGEYMPELISGQVQATFSVIPRSIDYIRTGQLRALPISSATRLEVLPGIPSVGEFLPGYEARGWYGVGAPKGTSTKIIEKLNKEIDAVVAEPNVKARLVGLGLQPMSLTSAEFGKFIADQTDKWAKVIRSANIKPE